MTAQTTATVRQPRPQFFRFSIRHLLIWTAAVAVACVALRSSSQAWISFANGIVLICLALAIPLVAYRTGATRAYWIGFALCGWLYMALLYLSWALPADQRQVIHLNHDQLLTTWLSKRAYQFAYPYTAARGPTSGMGSMDPYSAAVDIPYRNTPDVMAGGGLGGFAPGPAIAPSRAPEHEFVNTAHAFWTLLLAACGGWVVRWFYLTRDRDAS